MEVFSVCIPDHEPAGDPDTTIVHLVGGALRAVRKAGGFTQVAAADELRTTQSEVSSTETGAAGIGLRRLVGWMRAFGYRTLIGFVPIGTENPALYPDVVVWPMRGRVALDPSLPVFQHDPSLRPQPAPTSAYLPTTLTAK